MTPRASRFSPLDADDRDSAAIGEPIDQGENAAVIAHVPSIDFSKYPYTFIVVPGIGPTDSSTELSFGSQQHADLAADRYAAGWAPLFALTGGRVHPDRTTFAEALEMKKYLMTVRQIPEDVIIVDPYARHTTTNIRNVSRLAFRYGVPTNVHALIVTNFTQTFVIWGSSRGARSRSSPTTTRASFRASSSCNRTAPTHWILSARQSAHQTRVSRSSPSGSRRRRFVTRRRTTRPRDSTSCSNGLSSSGTSRSPTSMRRSICIGASGAATEGTSQ